MHAPADLIRDMRPIAARTQDAAEILRQLLACPAHPLALSRQWLEPLFYARDGQAGRTSTRHDPQAEHFISRAGFCAVARKSMRGAHIPNRKQRYMR
jgi:hypothetical protein